ncbi:MBL fold metallo-hydrolase [Rhodovibrionaceae bacterium A322]
MKVTVLGCGGSGGVPLAGNIPGGTWGECNPDNPRNRRRRSSIFIEWQGRNILIDASPDLRLQLIDNGITRVDAILITHAHADHTHGLDELRALSYAQGGPIPVFMDPATHQSLTLRFDYAFASSHKNQALYPALFQDYSLDYGTWDVLGLPVQAFAQHHGEILSTGFRFGDFAYSTDVVDFPAESFAQLEGLDTWIVDALRFQPHATHAHFDLTQTWIGQLKPRQAFLTHLNHTIDYDTALARCLTGVQPAYDGLQISLTD